MWLLMRGLSGDQAPDNCLFAKSLARFQPMKPLDQNKAVFIGSNENGGYLSNFQNTLRDFVNYLRVETFPPLHRNVNLVDC